MAKSCSERGSFSDEYQAREECRRLKEKYGSDYKEYLCSICGMWHVKDAQYQSSGTSSGCLSRYGERKRRYATAAEARQACLESLSSAVDFYYCKKCRGYHLTSHLRDKKGLRK